MWPDNETATDFLNFSGIADTVAEIVVQADGRPISIGVSGAWGVGKSSMIKLIRAALAQRDDPQSQGFVFVEFNAWLYQGYDDARAALLEVIASSLVEEAEKRKSGVDRAKELLSKVNWLRVGAMAASSVGAAFGVPPVGLAGEAIEVGRKLIAGKGESPEGNDASGSITRSPDESSPPKQIHAIRESLECTLSEMNVTLVVLIDDLDRCLPPTTISTLEAIRLFLFLQNTAFVVAADDTMIKHAVRRHLDDVGEALATNYFDKLIQVPIRVPPLGTQEVRAYMMLLFVEDSSLSVAEKEGIRASVCEQLSRTWRGHRVDRAFMETLHDDLPNELRGRLDTADRLAPLMTTTSQIGGNPRLIKRFLNALAVRMAISRAHGVGVDEAVLAKILLFERCAAAPAYDALTKQVNDDAEGKPRLLGSWEEGALAGREVELGEPWDDPFIREWLTVSPPLADTDLRGVLYVSREHAPLITAEDRLSSEGAELLNAVLEHPDMAGELHERLTALPRPETTIIMDRILERAWQFQEWGTPPILDGALAIATADPIQGQRLAAFLGERPVVQIRPNIVPKIGDQPWAGPVLDAWYDSSVASPVKAAITRERKNRGHL
ncbi:MAG: ATPase [Dehalococcoidia bacterium]|nr:ATPase [Dehalococcoidia bacterium]MYA52124.1 ATPase [Dehalococcoidia bacterium]